MMPPHAVDEMVMKRPRQSHRPRTICIVAAVPISLTAFMAPHARAMAGTYRIMLVASSDAGVVPELCGPNVTFTRVDISRGISLAADMKALFKLIGLFRRHRFDLVQSITPKAGLLTMVAGRLARVPRRVHWFTGQVWATRTGAGRWLLKSMDRVLAACSTDLLADSSSQRAFLIREGIVGPTRVVVLGKGSTCGVDLRRFRPDPEVRARVRARLGIPNDAAVALYLGRLNRDKGIPELAAAFVASARACARLHLLVVGYDEEGIRSSLEHTLRAAPGRAHFVGPTAEPEAYMTAADFFVLPSHREGFPITVLEAAGCAIPSIGTCIYGLTDALIDGQTGILVPVRDVEALSAAMTRLAVDECVRRDMGTKARQRVERHFSQAKMTAALSSYYARLFDPMESVE